MKQIIINGNKKLNGTIKIGGAKNSAVALLPAALLSDDGAVITNVPNISDKDALVSIIELLNCKIENEDTTFKIDTNNLKNVLITEELSTKLRASYYFMGVLLARFKKVEIYLPGGCPIGERPINLHLKGFEALGAKVTVENSKYILEADELIGTPIHLDFASVGATINIMFAATKAKGKTIITNAAKEPEIVNIANFLIKMGAKITGAGTSKIEIEGVDRLHNAEIEVLSDRVECGTYIIVGALIGENFKVDGVIKEDLEALLSKLEEMDIKYTLEDKVLTISKNKDIKPINVKSLVHPGFPTDLGQPMQVLMTQATGISFFEETIWENRMGHVKYLNKMGADIKNDTNTATITGPTRLSGAAITAVDLRGGAALVLAALIAEGETVINDADHILRGYEKIINKLTAVGANIKIREI